MMKRYHGIPVSPGVAMGKALVLHSEDFFAVPKSQVGTEDIPREVVRFEEALTKTRADLVRIRKNIANKLGHEHSDIFSAHLLILEDRTLIEDVISKIKEEKVGAEYAFSLIIQRYFRAFSQIQDEYLRERVADIRDVGRRVMQNLLGKEKDSLIGLKEKVIVVAHDLAPTETAMMDREHVIAFVTDIGGPTSHTAIMARSLEIPAVVGLDTVSTDIVTGNQIIVDGHRGILIVEPDLATIENYSQQERRFVQLVSELDKLKSLPAETLDGHRIRLEANIEFPDEIPSVLAHGAEGIGLYRTEYFYMNRRDLPNEQEQYEAYRIVVEKLAPSPVIIRTLDLGGDKFLSFLDMPQEMNPFMGWRAIRFCLSEVEIFKTQLRAILRASVHGNLKVMYPMVSNVQEIRRANEILEQAKQELRNEQIAFDNQIDVGIMIEIPSAAITSDILSKEAKFFSIGTNDLIQYSLAVDRINPKIAYLYEPTHPAIIRLIRQVIENSKAAQIPTSVCGEMAADPGMAVLLLGLGIDELSMSPFALPTVKKAIRSVSFKDAQDFAKKATELTTGEEIKHFVKSRMKTILPELFEE
ncbi:MAG: phosphoenolpyruvate--protein phosphotransferase [Omnitrophica bacterium RIFCSPLOWO2_12_FULL_44_17]|uniref:Phosphoenolpyruvate-protein phosphotransferase n=1 Tax=Candidatus Danuiimicrobium aquiferis TaxID=1801832 RepID=A0A1G1L209_9BACT|nr:MAG: phosphoenolpyruvate--protein phosphotransferase [Omnitrophica bacterium RIFCSPHIGHO2_02_FULL_45_28]OGW91282.1 MAG: phosphoenolpyruvate--protein phosphotransferase [Omnitrophica bacterium RIFCSPHIGHO2_12_FULL_44_12]OGW99187.1 MAG: phosphoenolpyruvate--protein phosphotransferase [Omnitrophica bacterium RIFCSPLOWO2_12_FULL_44_17]OGX04397.1 MAG: phosphoenolpyruvate--protein phosphotransferase [Omnitrophica bacterium RIFCSPLOWO2_02_FULL_44_11]